MGSPRTEALVQSFLDIDKDISLGNVKEQMKTRGKRKGKREEGGGSERKREGGNDVLIIGHIHFAKLM